jgi:addiction module HigA family antidote
MKVSRPALSNMLNGKAGISPEMAVRLSKAIGGTPGLWLQLQMNYDLAQVEQGADSILVTPLQAVHAV